MSDMGKNAQLSQKTDEESGRQSLSATAHVFPSLQTNSYLTLCGKVHEQVTRMEKARVDLEKLDLASIPYVPGEPQSWRQGLRQLSLAIIDKLIDQTRRELIESQTARRTVDHLIETAQHPPGQLVSLDTSTLLREMEKTSLTKDTEDLIMAMASEKALELRAALTDIRRVEGRLDYKHGIASRQYADSIERAKTILTDPSHHKRLKQASDTYASMGRTVATPTGDAPKKRDRRDASLAPGLELFCDSSAHTFNLHTALKTLGTYESWGRAVRMGWQLYETLLSTTEGMMDVPLELTLDQDLVSNLKEMGDGFRKAYGPLTLPQKSDKGLQTQYRELANTIFELVDDKIQFGKPSEDLSAEECETVRQRLAHSIAESEALFADGSMMLSAPKFVERVAYSAMKLYGPTGDSSDTESDGMSLGDGGEEAGEDAKHSSMTQS